MVLKNAVSDVHIVANADLLLENNGLLVVLAFIRELLFKHLFFFTKIMPK